MQFEKGKPLADAPAVFLLNEYLSKLCVENERNFDCCLKTVFGGMSDD